MNLSKKKELAKRALGVGKERIVFLESRLEDIKEAITKQDIKDLHKEGAIIIKDIKGRKKVKRKKRRGTGKIKKKVKRRKQDYVILVRKQRKYVSELRKREELSREEVISLRKKIRNKDFRSKAHLKEFIGGKKK